MKLHLASAGGVNLFTGYGAGYVAVNQVRYERAIVVSARSIMDWPVTSLASLGPEDFSFVTDWRPEILLLGTGVTQRFPGAGLARALAAMGTGIEVMDTRAACRTYNILAAEGREVVAALLPGGR